MPISKTCLPDVNVWVALVFDGHVHHQAATRWFNPIQETIAFCRVTQMGFLRLISNPKVMGKAVLTQKQAWHHYDQLLEDPRITFLNEPSGLEPVWRSVMHSQVRSRSWTDAYLMAFATARDLTLVTFDRALQTATDSGVTILS